MAKTISHYAESSAKRLEWDETMTESMREVARSSIASQTAKAAALLAGAEALDAVEVAKAALDEAKACIWDAQYGRGLSVPYAREVSVKIDAALARLEGK